MRPPRCLEIWGTNHPVIWHTASHKNEDLKTAKAWKFAAYYEMNLNLHFYLNIDRVKRQYFTTTDRQEPCIQYTNTITSSSFIQCLKRLQLRKSNWQVYYTMWDINMESIMNSNYLPIFFFTTDLNRVCCGCSGCFKTLSFLRPASLPGGNWPPLRRPSLLMEFTVVLLFLFFIIALLWVCIL